VESRVQALVKYAGGHYEGPLALPMPPAGAPADGQSVPGSDQVPPLPTGPWNNPSNPADTSQSAPNPPQPADPPPLPGPWGNANGPWGHH
jgi:heat shock protein HtpX